MPTCDPDEMTTGEKIAWLWAKRDEDAGAIANVEQELARVKHELAIVTQERDSLLIQRGELAMAVSQANQRAVDSVREYIDATRG